MHFEEQFKVQKRFIKQPFEEQRIPLFQESVFARFAHLSTVAPQATSELVFRFVQATLRLWSPRWVSWTRADYEMLETGEWPARTPADSRAAMLGAVVGALESQSGDVRVDGPLVRSVA